MCEPYAFTGINVFFVCPLGDENDSQEPDEGGLSGHSIIALAVCGVVAIAIVCGTVVVALHKFSTKLSASEMAMENPACKAGETI